MRLIRGVYGQLGSAEVLLLLMGHMGAILEVVWLLILKTVVWGIMTHMAKLEALALELVQKLDYILDLWRVRQKLLQ